MEKLLLNDYPSSFGLTRAHVNLSAELETGVFELYDNKACVQCNHLCGNKAIFKVCSEIPVTSVDIESYFEQFHDTRADVSGSRCDKLLYDSLDIRVVFVEMSCKEVATERHLKTLSNKRAKAYEQLRNSIDKLRSVSALQEAIDAYKCRSAIFAYRQNDAKPYIPAGI